MPEESNEFLRVIEEIDRMEVDPDRHVSIQLDQEMRAIVRAAKASGNPAKLVLTIVAKSGPDRRVTFAASHKATLPRPAANAVTLFADDDGGLHSADPAQLRLELTRATRKPAVADKE